MDTTKNSKLAFQVFLTNNSYKRARSFIHSYKGFGIHPSHCEINLFEAPNARPIVVATNKEGTSVTNAAEQLITEIVESLNLDPQKFIWVEHYDYEQSFDEEETYDVVSFEWVDEKGAVNVNWEPASSFFGTVE